MRGLLAGALLCCASACSSLLGINNLHLAGDASSTDGSGALDSNIDGMNCLGAGGLLSVCSAVPPSGSVMISGNLDTTSDARCTIAQQAGGPHVCEIAGATIDVQNVTVTGTYPLVLVAAGDLTVSGTLDASSTAAGKLGPGANDASCATPAGGPLLNSGAGGGAGGSFGAMGGDGGPGGGNAAMGGHAGPAVTALSVRGGCPGGLGGQGQGVMNIAPAGPSGGAVYLIAGTSISVAGAVFASGGGGGGANLTGGGSKGGGGGGGTGGLIGLDAPTINVTGIIAANGGGGGGGGDASTGHPGSDGTTINYSTPAAGGLNEGGAHGGIGGNGGAAQIAAQAGMLPSGCCGGGGGGGGSVGIVWVKGTFTGTQVSPTPTLH